MTRDTIIELADSWSERKGKQFNLQKLYEVTCQHICKQNRFWWAKKYITFPLVIGTSTYDLSTTTIGISPALSETMVSEIVRITLILQSTPSLQIVDLTPIFDDDGIFSMLENVTNAQPSRYTMGMDGSQVIRIDPPDKTYKIRLTFWAVPNFNDDTTSTAVPMIPPQFHNMIAEGMAAQILENTYGLQDIKATTMRARYQSSLIDAQMRPRFTTDYVQSFASQDSDAVQGT